MCAKPRHAKRPPGIGADGCGPESTDPRPERNQYKSFHRHQECESRYRQQYKGEQGPWPGMDCLHRLQETSALAPASAAILSISFLLFSTWASSQGRYGKSKK